MLLYNHHMQLGGTQGFSGYAWVLAAARMFAFGCLLAFFILKPLSRTRNAVIMYLTRVTMSLRFLYHPVYDVTNNK